MSLGAVICPRCDGTGIEEGDHTEMSCPTCLACGGTGAIDDPTEQTEEQAEAAE